MYLHVFSLEWWVMVGLVVETDLVVGDVGVDGAVRH